MRSYTRESKSYTKDNRIKLVEAEEPDEDTRREANTMVLEV